MISCRCLAWPSLWLLLTHSVVFSQSVADPALRVQTWVRGLNAPTGAAFVDGGNTALVLEKNTGRVQIVQSRSVVGTALDLTVANDSERGLLGIALDPAFASNGLVYLQYTAAASDGGAALDNRVERYHWSGSTLSFDRRVITMPAGPGPNHDGGKLAFGPDGKLYSVIGDLNRNELTSNFNNRQLNRAGAILRVNPSGSNVSSNPFRVSNPKSPLNDIYAYGVRNSFGIAFDPVSGNLWDTENGPSSFDEINRVDRGFNSGWEQIMGPSSRSGGSVDELVSLGPAARYLEPKLSWEEPVAPTDAYFMENARLGSDYKNDLFVGTVRGDGVIYRFGMSPSRKTLGLTGPLADLVADNSEGALLAEQSDIIWGSGFGVVTDILSGPGGMYVTSLTNNAMYRITTGATGQGILASSAAVPEPSASLLLALTGATLLRRRHRETHAPSDLRKANSCQEHQSAPHAWREGDGNDRKLR